LDRSVSRWHKI